MKILSLLFLVAISPALSFTFTKGDGSEFKMKTKGETVDLSIYIADVSKQNMHVEFYFEHSGVLPVQMWQQFEMHLSGKSAIKVKQGYVKMNSYSPAEIMRPSLFNKVNQNGVQLSDFLFSQQADIDGSFVGDETVEIAAGSIIAKHYQKKNKGQTVDFWIADTVKPIGLVKLISKSEKKPSHNYEIELKSLLKNVQPMIKPKAAVPMTKETRDTLTSNLSKQ